jgi:hypothetical protein
MDKALVCLTVATVVGGILFVQFLMEIWREKEKRRSKRNWDKFDNF